MTINVIDAPMGAGKTSTIINDIKLRPREQRFIYVTPYVEEVKRVRNALSDFNFVDPDAETFGTKSRSFEYWLDQNQNIVTTHSLFCTYLTDHVFDKIAQKNYILFMDEVSTPVDDISLYPRDVELMDDLIFADDDGVVHVKDNVVYPERGAKFSTEIQMARAGNLYRLSKTCLVQKMPVNRFAAFKEVFLATYMFDCQIQKYYFDLYGYDYKYLGVKRDVNENYHITDETVDYNWIKTIRPLINIYEGKYNDIGAANNALSKNWYDKQNSASGMGQIEKLSKNTRNFFLKTGASSKDAIWTSFSTFHEEVAPRGYAKPFVALNTRATNKYRHCTAVAYLINYYCNVHIKSYFAMYGIKVDEERLALSEMLQFIWRAAIRDGKPIDVYIPSSRMRNLLKGYIN